MSTILFLERSSKFYCSESLHGQSFCDVEATCYHDDDPLPYVS
jgi:hypothetical protein